MGKNSCGSRTVGGSPTPSQWFRGNIWSSDVVEVHREDFTGRWLVIASSGECLLDYAHGDFAEKSAETAWAVGWCDRSSRAVAGLFRVRHPAD